MKTITLAESLGLREGWTATRFPGTIELEHTSGIRTGIPVPYEPMSEKQWKEAAANAVMAAKKSKPTT